MLSQLMQIPSRVSLTTKHAPHTLPTQRGDHTIIQRPSSMHHPPQHKPLRHTPNQPPNTLTIRHITSNNLNPRTKTLQLPLQLQRTRRTQPTTTSQHQTTNTMLNNQMPRNNTTNSPRTTSHQHRTTTQQRRCRHAQHDLADMTRLAHETKRLRRITYVPHPHRQRLQRALLEQARKLLQHLVDPLGAGLLEAERRVGHTTMRS